MKDNCIMYKVIDSTKLVYFLPQGI